jgi:hypothetical protein
MKTLFLAWQDPSTRAWFPVGKLTHDDDGRLYHFVYLQGAIEAKNTAGFQPIISLPDFYQPYGSLELFPLFQNRLLRPSRPDYSAFIESLSLSIDQTDPIAILSRSGGRRQTDNFEVFPAPERNEVGQYQIHFFSHGLSHCPADAQQRVITLQPSDKLSVMHDCQNPVDGRALMLRTEDLHNVGFCPRYLTQDFFELVEKFPHKVQVTVVRINPAPMPLQSRLLCCLTSDWEDKFAPFSGPSYEPLAQIATSAIA